MKYIFIINPIAGNDDKAKIFSRIQSTFRMLENDDMIIEETKAQGDAKNIASDYANKYGKDCVIVSCGGDGTVHEIANGLAGTDTPMLVLPLGTGNDFAKTLYKTKTINVENVIKSFGFYNGKIKYDIVPIDLIDYNGEKGINVMSFGVDTVVETIGKRMAEKAPFLGHTVYKLAIVPTMMKSIRYHISCDLDCVNIETGEEYKYHKENLEYALMAICNASYYGGGFCPAPNANLTDGLLDLCIVHDVNQAQAVPLISLYSKGELNDKTSEKCINAYVKSGKIWMNDGSSLLGNSDGENFDYSTLDFKVLPKALKLCVIK